LENGDGMSLTAKRADKLAILAMNVTYAANDVADNMSDLGDTYLTKGEREGLTDELQDSFISLEGNFNDLKSRLKKWEVI
jgi:hypothetical protein